jgi:hypothetical protein
MKLYINISIISCLLIVASCSSQKDTFDDVRPELSVDKQKDVIDTENVDTSFSVSSDTSADLVVVDTTELNNDSVKRVDSIRVQNAPVVLKHKAAVIKRQLPVVDTMLPIKVINDDPCMQAPPEGLYIRNPLTKEEARLWGKYLWRKAECFWVMDIDSCCLYANKGIEIYENGSLFAIKSYCLLVKKQYSGAKTLAEISIARNDHWGNDKDRAYSVRVKALEGIAEQYPSSLLQSQIEKARIEYDANKNK